MSHDEDFGTFGRYVETPVAEMPSEMRSAYNYTKELRGLVPGPHKIWLANPTLSKTIVATGNYFQKICDADQGGDRDCHLCDQRPLAFRLQQLRA